jgi:hypothetical protein
METEKLKALLQTFGMSLAGKCLQMCFRMQKEFI